MSQSVIVLGLRGFWELFSVPACIPRPVLSCVYAVSPHAVLTLRVWSERDSAEATEIQGTVIRSGVRSASLAKQCPRCVPAHGVHAAFSSASACVVAEAKTHRQKDVGSDNESSPTPNLLIVRRMVLEVGEHHDRPHPSLQTLREPASERAAELS